MERTVLILIGPGLLLLSLVVLVTQVRFRSRTIRTTGTVVACEERRQTRERMPRTVHTLTVRYVAVDGGEHEFRESRAPALRPGDEVGVRYDPGDPGDARLDQSAMTLALTVLVMSLMGTAGTVALLRG